MILRNEELDSVMGFELSEDSFFSEGTVILIDGSAWELTETCGVDFVFKPSKDMEMAISNNQFFYSRNN